MADSMDFHIKLGPVPARLMKKLMEQTGMSRTDLVRFAIYRLAIHEKLITVDESFTEPEGKS